MLAIANVVGFTFFMQQQITSLLPADIGSEVLGGIRTLLLYQMGVLVVLAIVLSAISFYFNTHLIVRPLKKIITAMDAFTTNGDRVPMSDIGAAPQEIRLLASVFDSFAERVEIAHAHDVEVSRVKSDFISTAAHQLRTPLTGIRWALEALEKEPLNEIQQSLVKSAVDKSRDLVTVVGTLLDISSIESGKYKYTFAPVSVQSLVAEITKDFMPLAAEHKVTLQYQIGEGTLPNARADRERIKWVLNNLIENAIRYTPSGGSVTVSVAAAPGRVQVRVHDTGIGIEPKDRGNIFERFYRAGNAIIKENKGSGLGLYIARTIATDHGGDLNFMPNTDSTGTTFVLSLPIAG